MAGIEIDRLIYLILLLLMVAGWFFMQNRQSLNKTLQQAAIWGFIFLAVIAGIGLWEDISRTVSPQHSIVSGTGQVTIPRSIDGHYYLTAKVNDASVRFVVDTGATDIVLTQQDAERAGLHPTRYNISVAPAPRMAKCVLRRCVWIPLRSGSMKIAMFQPL